MASKTTNYGLNKHSPQDFYNVEARNENWDKIDKVLAATDPTKVTTKVEPADGDGVMIADSADGGKAKRLLWSNVKAALGKLFVPLARKINGKTLSADVTLTGDDIAVSTTDPTPISGAVKYRTNPNLLDNWYFGRPVNQRGQTSYTGSAKYSIDRWFLQYSTYISIVDGGVKLSGFWDIQQYFENTFPNATYTLSLLYKDKTGTDELKLIPANRQNGDITQASSGDASGLLSITFTTGVLDKVTIGFTGSSDNSVTLLAAKLELGDTQTLAHKENGVWVLNEIPDYGEQLRRCQRYFVRLGFPNTDYCIIGDGVARDSQIASVMVPLPTKMRTNFPAASITGQITLRHSDTAIFVSTTASIDAGGVGATLLKCVTSGLTTGDTVEAFLEPQNYVDLSADL